MGFNCVRVPFWYRNFYYDDNGTKILDKNGEDVKFKATFTINIKDIPFEVQDGNILRFDGENYIKDETEYKSRMDIIKAKFKKVKKRY